MAKYSREQRDRAVDLYINTSAAPRTWIGYNVLDSPMRDE